MIIKAIQTITFLTTKEAAEILGITPLRVRQLIKAKRLSATRIGGHWFIQLEDLDAVKVRKWGRPKKIRAAKF